MKCFGTRPCIQSEMVCCIIVTPLSKSCLALECKNFIITLNLFRRIALFTALLFTSSFWQKKNAIRKYENSQKHFELLYKCIDIRLVSFQTMLCHLLTDFSLYTCVKSECKKFYWTKVPIPTSINLGKTSLMNNLCGMFSNDICFCFGYSSSLFFCH